MHSRIFILKTEQEVKDGDFYAYNSPEDVAPVIGADYVTEGDLAEDTEWLKSSYSIEAPLVTLKRHDETIRAAVLSKADISKILEHVSRLKREAVKKARSLLSAPEEKIDLWEVAETIYPRYSFWFELGGSLIREISLSDYVTPDDAPLYITETYDYHF